MQYTCRECNIHFLLEYITCTACNIPIYCLYRMQYTCIVHLQNAIYLYITCTKCNIPVYHQYRMQYTYILPVQNAIYLQNMKNVLPVHDETYVLAHLSWVSDPLEVCMFYTIQHAFLIVLWIDFINKSLFFPTVYALP